MPKHVDEHGNDKWTRIVYVIEPEPAACRDKKSHCDGDCGKLPVYVGETCHTAQERFAQHKAGYKASRWPRKYGVRVRPRLAGQFGEMESTVESKQAERELSRRLSRRARGTRYCVYGGH